MKEDIYSMGLHDIIWIHENTISILRVASGWIYTKHPMYGTNEIISSVFVPFDNQFQQDQK